MSEPRVKFKYELLLIGELYMRKILLDFRISLYLKHKKKCKSWDKNNCPELYSSAKLIRK